MQLFLGKNETISYRFNIIFISFQQGRAHICFFLHEMPCHFVCDVLSIVILSLPMLCSGSGVILDCIKA